MHRKGRPLRLRNVDGMFYTIAHLLALQTTAYTSRDELVQELGWTELRAQSILVSESLHTHKFLDTIDPSQLAQNDVKLYLE